MCRSSVVQTFVLCGLHVDVISDIHDQSPRSIGAAASANAAGCITMILITMCYASTILIDDILKYHDKCMQWLQPPCPLIELPCQSCCWRTSEHQCQSLWNCSVRQQSLPTPKHPRSHGINRRQVSADDGNRSIGDHAINAAEQLHTHMW